MKVVLIDGEGLNKHGKSACRGRGGGSSAMAIPLCDISGGNEASQTKTR